MGGGNPKRKDPRRGRARRTIASPKQGPGSEKVEPVCSLVTGDCVEKMRKLLGENGEGAGWADVTIMDPPYEASGQKKQRRTRDSKWDSPGNVVKKDLGFAPMTAELRMQTAWLVGELTKRWVLTFCEIEAVPDWRMMYETFGGLEYVRTCIWYKPDAMPQFSGDRPGQGYEAFLAMHKQGKKQWNGGGHHGHWTIRKNEKKDPVIERHPTQKPMELMEKLVTLFSNEGEMILDPFMGSGSTGLAAMRHGRLFYGIDIERKWMRIADSRINHRQE